MRAVGSVPVETLTAVLHVSILPEPDVPQMSQDMESASPPMVVEKIVKHIWLTKQI